MADFTLALSRNGIKDILVTLADRAAGKVNSDPVPLGTSVSYTVSTSWRFEVGDLFFAPMIELNETDFVLDFHFKFRIEVPKIEVGGQTVCFAKPFGEVSCVTLPVITLYDGGVFEFDIGIDGFRSEIEGAIDFQIVHFKPEESDQLDTTIRFFWENRVSNAFAETPEVSDFFAMAMKQGWELRIIPGWMDFDLIDEPGTIAGQFERELSNAITTWGADLSASDRNALLDLSGDLTTLIEGLLDIHDDHDTWILARISELGIVREVAKILSDRLGFFYLVKLLHEQKFPISEDIPFSEDIPPVRFEISNAALTIEPEELRIEVDIKAPDL